MSKFKAKLNTNFKGFKYLQNLIDEIIKRIDNIKNDDGSIKDLENTVKSLFDRITNLENKHNNEMKTLSDVVESNDNFLQSQINQLFHAKDVLVNKINQEVQSRKDGDSAINERLNSIQFTKWLKREDFGESADDDKMILSSEDWVKTFAFDDTKYKYTNTYIVSANIVFGQQEYSNRISEYGISIDIVPASKDDLSAMLQVTYNHSKNTLGNNNNQAIVIDVLYTQFRTDAEPDPMPY